MLRSDSQDFSGGYIVAKGTITVTNPDNVKRNKAVTYKNNAPFINCISKINGIQVDNAENLDVAIPMYNLQYSKSCTTMYNLQQTIYSNVQYIKNYRKTTGSLWNYYRDEPSDPLPSNSESLKYKASITGNPNNAGVGEAGYDATKVIKNETEAVISLKHLNTYFWKALNIPLINCKIGLILT